MRHEPLNGKRYKSAIILLGAMFFAALFVAGTSVFLRFDQTDKLRSEQKSVWFAVICSIEQAVQHNPKQHNKQQFYHFYDNLLVNKVHTKACGFASVKKGRR